MREMRQELESAISGFCLEHKDEFAKKRSRKLDFGRIAFRVAERIEYLNVLEESVIATLKSLGYPECVKRKESIDKNAVKSLPDNVLAKCGLKRIKDDHFRIEPNLELIAGNIGKDCPAATTIDVEKVAKLVLKSSEDTEEEAA